MACATAARRRTRSTAGCARRRRRWNCRALLERRPRELSGGQRQRVAMGRAIVRNPKVFLFDEPLSNLDAKLRGQMRVEIKNLQRSLGVTSVYVTHDQLEAMTLADLLVVMNAGAGRAGRQAARHLREAGLDLRRELHRRAADEFSCPAASQPSGARVDLPGGERIAAKAPPRRPGGPSPSASAPSISRWPRTLLPGARFTLSPIWSKHSAPTRWCTAEVGRGRPSFCSPACPATPSCAPATASPSPCRPEELHLFDPETGKALAGPNGRQIRSVLSRCGSIAAAGPLTTWRSLAGRPATIYAFIYVLAAASAAALSSDLTCARRRSRLPQALRRRLVGVGDRAARCRRGAQSRPLQHEGFALGERGVDQRHLPRRRRVLAQDQRRPAVRPGLEALYRHLRRLHHRPGEAFGQPARRRGRAHDNLAEAGKRRPHRHHDDPQRRQRPASASR